MKMNCNKYCTVLEGTIDEPILFHLHGFASRRDKTRSLSEFFNKLGYTTVFCDARGHGENIGKIYEIEETIDEYNRRINSIDFQSVIVIGHSIGASEAIHLAKNPKVKKVFAICPVTNEQLFENIHMLHLLILGTKLTPLVEEHVSLTRKLRQQNKEIEEKWREIEKEIKSLEKRIREIDPENDSELLKSLVTKVQENKWVHQLIYEIRENEKIQGFIKDYKNLVDNVKAHEYFNAIKEKYTGIKDFLNVGTIKDYYTSIQEVYEDLMDRRQTMYSLLPINLKLSPEEISKLYIIASKTDMIVPFENYLEIVEKFEIPKERTLEIFSPHGFANNLPVVKNFILDNIQLP